MPEFTIISERVYCISSISFKKELEELYRFAKHHKNSSSGDFVKHVYLEWNELTVHVDFTNSSSAVITLIGKTWFFNAVVHGGSYSSDIFVFLVNGNISDFEKWEMMLKLKRGSAQDDDDAF